MALNKDAMYMVVSYAQTMDVLNGEPKQVNNNVVFIENVEKFYDEDRKKFINGIDDIQSTLYKEVTEYYDMLGKKYGVEFPAVQDPQKNDYLPQMETQILTYPKFVELKYEDEKNNFQKMNRFDLEPFCSDLSSLKFDFEAGGMQKALNGIQMEIYKNIDNEFEEQMQYLRGRNKDKDHIPRFKEFSESYQELKKERKEEKAYKTPGEEFCDSITGVHGKDFEMGRSR